MKTITLNKTRTAQLPTAWNELSKEQLLFVCGLFLKKYTKEKFNVIVLSNFLNLGKKQILRIKPSAIAELAEIIEFLHNECKLTMQLIPELIIKKKKYLGPQSALQDCRFEEFFLYTETCFNQYVETNDEKHLDTLIATLYREADRENEIEKRRDFDPDEVEIREPAMRKLAPEVKLAIFLFYAGSKLLISKKFPNCFKKGDSAKKDDLAYLKLLNCLNNDSLANNDIVKQANVYETFVKLEQKILEAEEIQRNMNKNK